MDAIVKGPWNRNQIDSFLESSRIPLRLACVAGSGFPSIVSVWYGYDGECLRSVSHRSSGLVKMLRRDGHVGFEVAPNTPPYHGVRGQGIARLGSDADGEVLGQMLKKYLGGAESQLARWLLSRSEDEVLITVKPQRLFSWDYRERMKST